MKDHNKRYFFILVIVVIDLILKVFGIVIPLPAPMFVIFCVLLTILLFFITLK